MEAASAMIFADSEQKMGFNVTWSRRWRVSTPSMRPHERPFRDGVVPT